MKQIIFKILKKIPVLSSISKELVRLRSDNEILRNEKRLLGLQIDTLNEELKKQLPAKVFEKDFELKTYGFDQIPGRKVK